MLTNNSIVDSPLPLQGSCSMDNLFCLILAGGKGRRLWPESRVEMPKQFIDFFGFGRTQLQQTYRRFRSFLSPEQIFISTQSSYCGLVEEQLPECPRRNIITEPIWRNTGPSTAWGARKIWEIQESRNHGIPKISDAGTLDGVLILAPSDHEVKNIEAFKDDVMKGAEFVSKHDVLLTMGIQPTRPETGYGYIQMGKEEADGIFRMKSYTEKPDRDFANMFIESGEFLWNTGIYITTLRGIHEASRAYMDSVNYNDFTTFPNLSIERAFLDKAQFVSILKCQFGWSDLGTWHAIYDAEQKDAQCNVVLNSNAVLDNSHGNIVKVPKGHQVVINGLDNFIVVEQGDVLLICPKEESSALIRKYSATLNTHY